MANGTLPEINDNKVFGAPPIFRLLRGLSFSSKRLIAMGTVLMLAMVAAVSLATWDLRVVTLRHARQNVAKLGIAIAEQTSRSVQSVDLVLQGVRENVLNKSINTPTQFKAVLQTKAMHDILAQQQSGLPQANAFTIIGTDGKLINFSRKWPIPSIDLSDRDYFKYFRGHDDTKAFISSPVMNRGDGVWTVYVVRRVDSSSGQFLGLLLGAIQLDYFRDFYKAVTADGGASIVLLNRDGIVLASFPPRGQTGQRLLRQNSVWSKIVATGRQATFDAFLPGWQSVRLVSVQPLQDYPLVVNVGESKWDALADWRMQALLAGVGTASGMLCVFLVLRALALQLRRLEISETSLAEQNAELIAVEERIRFLAEHDDLTKLMNRRIFREALIRSIEHADNTHGGVAVFYLDLDRFKLVNDTRGHTAGDLVLVQIAARLRKAARGDDIVARTGGDEFAIIRPKIRELDSCKELAETLLETMRKPFEVEGLTYRINISLGIACYPEHAGNAEDLLRNADTALYEAKVDGRGVYRVFDETMGARRDELSVIEQELRQALELKQFELDYQPIVETSSREITAFEVLLRWRHPQRGLIPPGNFIGLAENMRLIAPIGHWLLASACAEAVKWPQGIALAVNLSPLQFNDETLFDTVTETLQRTGLQPSRLVLEITEGLMLEGSSSVLGIMRSLSAIGVRFCLDDFGTGHSGLGYLRQFVFDAIKIDKMFINDMVDQPDARSIVAALLAVSSALNLDVIAEGVETEAQLKALQLLGCQYIQGFLTGRPEPAEKLHRLLYPEVAGDGAACPSEVVNRDKGL